MRILNRLLLTLYLVLSLSSFVFAQDTSVMDREIRELSQRIYDLNTERNSEINLLNGLIPQLKNNHSESLYAEYQQKSELVKAQLASIDELKSQRVHLINEKKIRMNATRELSVRQLTQREETSIGTDIFISSSNTTDKPIPVFEQECEKEEQLRANSPHRSHPNFRQSLSAINHQSKLCSIDAIVDKGTGVVSGIELVNTFSKNSNPTGQQDPQLNIEANRKFVFNFDGRSRQNMYLSITDDVAVAKLESSDLMEKSIIFIPRKIFPYVDMSQDDSDCCQTKVFLPTGEFVIFDRFSNEILEGVLSELPIDRGQSRHSRGFPQINYNGNGITIEASRRGGLPEKIYTTSFNKNEDLKRAIIKHKGKVCKVSKSVIWDGTSGHGPVAFKYNTDQEFLTAVINKTGTNGCGWNLTMEDISSH